jgi:uncharacterized membrane protein
MPGRWQPRSLAAAIVVLALAGTAVSGYLTAVHYAHRPVFCGGLSSCETVNTSAYAELMGVPVALLGLLAYLTIGGLAVLRGRLAWAEPALLTVAAAGTLYSGYLTWVELAVLHAVCLWCVTSAVIITVITVLATALVLHGEPAAYGAPPTPARGRRQRFQPDSGER